MRKDLERRLEALEEGTGPIIDDLADFVQWAAVDYPSNWRWDPVFERQMEDLVKEIAEEDIRE